MRSLQLRPLCNEHLDGLKFVSRIRQGISKISNDRLRDYILWYWSNHIRPHFFQEEKILMPLIPAEHPLSVKMKDDHSYIRELILCIDIDADNFTIKTFCDLLGAHIHFEEVSVYPYLEQHLTENELNRVHEELEKHPVKDKSWIDLFWEMNDNRKNVLN